MTIQPADHFEEPHRQHLLNVIKRALLATSGTPLRPSASLQDELATLNAAGIVPSWVSVTEFRELWEQAEQQLLDDVHASRASRRGL